MPIAIQLNEDDTKLWQPHEQWAWTMAKTAVQSADHHHHELVHHLAQAHLFMEAITLSCERQLSSEHPLHVLLKPHLHDTLDINETARKNLISPGGQVEELMSPTHEGDLQIIAKGYESIDLSILNFPLDLKLRGMEETAFPYAYGEDGLSIWQCIASFASSYVDLYYLRDEDMTEDIELHNFFNELRSEQGCRLKNISPPSNLEDLKTFLSAVIFRGSAFHAVVNYGQYPYGGFSPNMPASLSSSAPEAGQHYEERDWLGMLPSLDRSLEWVNLMFQLSHIYGTTLGQGLDEHLSDPRAGELLQTFQTELANTEELIRDRNSKRKTPFELLLPSRIPASIFI
jgi:arachidonate 15-lipoxygenase